MGATAEETTAEETRTPEKKEIPVDIFSDKMPDKEVLPLDGQVKTKDYAAIPDQQPTGTTGTSADTAENKSGTATGSDQGQGPTPTPQPNPDEIKNQAEQTVDLMLKGYDKLHMLGRYLGKVDQNELSTLHAKGKIDLDLQLPIGKKNIQVKEFFAEYNESIEENISVSDEFKDNIKPPLTRICIKRGWLLSDELYVASIVTEDLTTKVSLLIGLKKSANIILAACMDIQKKKTEVPKETATTGEPGTQQQSDPDWKEPEE